MPISVTCPECESTYRVPDEAAGKAIKCKKCGARISVSAGADDEATAGAGARNGDEDRGDEDRSSKPKKKGGSGKLIGIIAGVVVLFGCCCILPPGIGGLGYYLGWFDKVGGGGGNVILDKSDTLTQAAPKTKQGKPALPYKLKLEAGKRYTIDMKASHPALGTQDPYLLLENSAGAVVAQDDDGGGNFNAQIRFTPPATGDYTIQATSFGSIPPGGIPFRLTVRQH